MNTKKYGINPDNLRDDKFYDSNIIIQSFGKEDDNEDRYIVTPLNYMPRKERCDYLEFDLSDEKQKEEFLEHLRDSQERLKILSLLLHKQEEEIMEFGYPKTTCYYPDLPEESEPRFEKEYRPFLSLEECRIEMEKHRPFGWIKEKESGFYSNILSLTSLGCFLDLEEDPESFEDLYRIMTFYDGKPFGEEIK